MTAGHATDKARQQAEALGHQLEPFQPTHYVSVVTARCAACRRAVWAGRYETFGPAIEVVCPREA